MAFVALSYFRKILLVTTQGHTDHLQQPSIPTQLDHMKALLQTDRLAICGLEELLFCCVEEEHQQLVLN